MTCKAWRRWIGLVVMSVCEQASAQVFDGSWSALRTRDVVSCGALVEGVAVPDSRSRAFASWPSETGSACEFVRTGTSRPGLSGALLAASQPLGFRVNVLAQAVPDQRKGDGLWRPQPSEWSAVLQRCDGQTILCAPSQPAQPRMPIPGQHRAAHHPGAPGATRSNDLALTASGHAVDLSAQRTLRDALQAGALVGSLLMLAIFSFVWWLLSRRATLAWQSLGLMLLCVNQLLAHSILKYFVHVTPFDMTYKAACVVGSLCPMVLMLYLRSVARAYKLRISGVPVFIAMGLVHIVLGVAILASDWDILIQASHFSVLTILSALVVAGMVQIRAWKLRYSMVVLSCLVLLWGVRFRDFAIGNSISIAVAGPGSYSSGFSTTVIVLFGLAFWIHHQVAWRQKNETKIADLLIRQNTRLERVVRRRTQTLNAQLVAARHTNGQQTRLMAYVGHDLRAPMATIVGYARLLRNIGSPAHKKHIAAIEDGAVHQLVLIDELLDHVRGELHLFSLKPVALDLHELLEDIRQHATVMAGRQHNIYRFDRPDPLPRWVMLDGNRLRQVLFNLISNAAKYTHHGSITLTVAARYSGPDWTMTFQLTDTGTGIDAEDQERIFGSFEQAQPTDGGLGLGLFIARSIVETMAGRLTLDSTPGAGSTFRFEIAISAAQATPASVHPAREAMEPAADQADTRLNVVMKKTSPASLAELFLLASTGQWTGINQWLVDTSLAQPKCGAFIALVARLLEDLDFKRIRELAAPEAAPGSAPLRRNRSGSNVDTSGPHV